MKKLRTVIRYFINSVLAAVISILILNLFFWGMRWLIEKPFDHLGWLRMIVDLTNYSQCTLRIDYVMQSLLLLCVLTVPAIGIILIIRILNSR